ncbi:MAG: cadmium-translocating P-type ATPase [Spirochaetaceae bacterium]|jgi:Cd2+/Zn2+-exporting ATPase|nr:cadmium-translocating P-type ATPase [Spirochaetaceae bacterium]
MKKNPVCCCERCDAWTEEEDAGARSAKWRRIRMAAGVALAASGVAVSFGLAPPPLLASIQSVPHAELAVFIAAFLLIGADVLLRSLKNIARGKIFDENFLMSVSSVGAFFIGEYPEAVAVMLFYKIGEAFEDSAVGKSRASIGKLMHIRPDYANVQRDGGISRVKPSGVRVGEVIFVKAGERVPLDGVVTSGASSLDVSALTGEAAPRDVCAGSEILSGSINNAGLLFVRVTKTEGESTVSKILELVEKSGEKKSRMENFITRFARWYTPFVCLAALLLATLPPLFLGASSPADFAPWVYRAFVFLVVSCPCALVVSVPLSFFGGIGAASKNGVLIKGGNCLEALCKAKTIIFDKTGTLTKGVFRVTEVVPAAGRGKEDLLRLAASAESFSNHPIARSICGAYGKDIDRAALRDVEEVAGKGVKITLDGKRVIAGNARLFEDEGIAFQTHTGGGAAVCVAIDGAAAGFLVVGDQLKEDAARTVAELRRLGIDHIAMLTGDAEPAAAAAAREAGIEAAYSELLPHEKCARLEAIKAQRGRGSVVFVGDGINDAPCLALSDVGVAMGGIGSDAAIEAADIVLMNDELSKIPLAIRIARKTHGIALQNIVFALGVKGIILLAGAAGGVSIWVAVFGDVGVALIAILNSMRALKA